MSENLPYSTSVGTLETMLEKIKAASVPERFTQDFVSTKLAMKGGTAKACIPFLKKMGFVASDGTPTELYKEFRNPKKSRIAIGKSFKNLYERLYEMNEYVHDATDQDVMGLIVQCTGGERDAPSTKYTLWTFNALRRLADFDFEPSSIDSPNTIEAPQKEFIGNSTTINPVRPYADAPSSKGINLAYTINLNLPATKDIEVFNAIFKSLKTHLLEN